MGLNMVERLVLKKHRVIAYDLSLKARNAAKKAGAKVADSLKELTDKLPSPKMIRVMVPAGKPTA